MPEKKYPPRFNFKTLEPDVPVEFTLLREPFSGKATKDGEEYEWHLWPVKHTDIEMSLFTPNDRVHAGLQYLKVQPQGKFTLTKKASVNTGTGKPFIYYEMEYGDRTIDTKDSPLSEPPPETLPEAPTDWDGVPPIKEPKERPVNIQKPAKIDYVEEFHCYYGPIMTNKLKYMETRINMQKLTDGQFAELLIALDKSTSANVSTILIQNGGK